MLSNGFANTNKERCTIINTTSAIFNVKKGFFRDHRCFFLPFFYIFSLSFFEIAFMQFPINFSLEMYSFFLHLLLACNHSIELRQLARWKSIKHLHRLNGEGKKRQAADKEGKDFTYLDDNSSFGSTMNDFYPFDVSI